MKEQLKLCESVARKAHGTQTRRDGRPYISHPQRVASMFPDNRVLACIAWLHDVIEDSDETVESLIEKGVSSVTANCVDLITRKNGQDYDDYLDGIVQMGDVAKVKIADITDNLCDSPTENQKNKYHKAIGILLGSL